MVSHINVPSLLSLAFDTFCHSKTLDVEFLGTPFYRMQPPMSNDRRKFYKDSTKLFYQMYKHTTFDTTVLQKSK